MQTKLISKIKRQRTLSCDEKEDMLAYDHIKTMKWEGIPTLRDKAWYVEFKDPTGRNLIQQAINLYATHRPKWDVLPIGPNDEERAKRIENIAEWYMKLANDSGRKYPLSEALTSSTTYNKICGQIEWDNDYFCIKNYNPQTVEYEYGNKLLWVAVVENVTAVSILEHWGKFGEESRTESARNKKAGGIYDADKIKASLQKIQKLVDDDEEQRMVYVDYTDDNQRFVYCYPASDDRVDDELGVSDDGEYVDGLVVIQDKANSLGFINWAIAEGEGDPLLAPLHKADLWLNTNRSETIKRSIAYRNSFFTMFIEEGAGEDVEYDFSGDFPSLRVPPGKRITQTQQLQLDPVFNELSAQDRSLMTSSAGISETSNLQAANVQFATINALIQLRQAQTEPYKRTFEKYAKQLVRLMFRYAKKKNITLLGRKMERVPGRPTEMRGAEVSLRPEEMVLDKLYIECELLPNNSTDMMQRVNSFMTMRQGGAPLAWSEIFERLGMEGQMSMSKFEDEEIARSVLETFKAKMMQDLQLEGEQARMQMQAELQQQQMAQQQEAEQMQMQQQAQIEQQGQVAAQQGLNQPIQQMAQGQGFNAAMGGGAPQAASPELTQTAGV